MKVGLVVHDGRDGSIATAEEASALLRERGVDVVEVDDGRGAHGLDLVLSFGGDGTLLRAAHLCRDEAVPLLGLNLGRLGFLTEVEREDLDDTLDVIVAGDLNIEERETLEVRAVDAAGRTVHEDWALNEVSVEKTARQRLLHMALHVGGRRFAHVPADAVVVATPTGSTAYAFSAGGPILSPSVRATVVTPVAPHSTFGRSLVVAPEEEVRIEVLPDQEPAVVSCDGRGPETVPAGGSVYVVGGGHPVRLVRLRPRDFFGRVRAKFGLR